MRAHAAAGVTDLMAGIIPTTASGNARTYEFLMHHARSEPHQTPTFA